MRVSAWRGRERRSCWRTMPTSQNRDMGHPGLWGGEEVGVGWDRKTLCESFAQERDCNDVGCLY
jgi:hypothetical protein